MIHYPGLWNGHWLVLYALLRFVNSSVFSFTLIRSSARNSRTDEQLVADFRQTNDPRCVEILFNRYCHLVFAVALKYLHNEEQGKDAVIEIFEKIPAHLHRYDIKKFSHWIYIVTRNYCYQVLKKRTPHLPEEAIDQRPENSWNGPDEDAALGKYLLEHLEDSLASLNKDQRTCVTLFYLQEKSYEEIERLTGFSYNQVKSHIQNGKRNLRIYLSRFMK